MASHKIIVGQSSRPLYIVACVANMGVDGLSRLPPIKLKPEEEEEEHLDEKTPRASSFGKRKVADTGVDDADDSDKPRELTTMPPVDSDKTIVLEDSAKFVTSPESTTPPEGIPNATNDKASTSSSLAPPAPLTLDDPDATSSSPKLTISPAPPTHPTPVSGDIILPLMIFAVVKTNPPHLVSHLLYTQRFRYQAVGGEESYCLINLLAVAEFLENVDLAALGLGEKEKSVLRYVVYMWLLFPLSLCWRDAHRMDLCTYTQGEAIICPATSSLLHPSTFIFAHVHRFTVMLI